VPDTVYAIDNAQPSAMRLQTHRSTLVERVLEYQLLAALTPELLRRGLNFEVLRGDTDRNGHDLVMEANGIMRHIQLKGMVAGGKARWLPINVALGTKPSGCVVLMNYDPAQLTITALRWFGGMPGKRLPDTGDRQAHHSKANSQGVKAIRPNIRELPVSQFIRMPDIAALADHLFGPQPLAVLRQHLREYGADEGREGWLHAVRGGDFTAIPRDLDWDRSCEFAHLVSGYDLAGVLGLGDPMEYEARQLEAAVATGVWPGCATELWITLFLEHRRWRFSSPFEPDPDMQRLLDTLVRQLRTALTGEAL